MHPSPSSLHCIPQPIAMTVSSEQIGFQFSSFPYFLLILVRYGIISRFFAQVKH